MQKRVSANALELARNGTPKQPFYLTGQAGGRSFSVHAEGERVILTREGQERQEIDLSSPGTSPAPGTTPGSSPAPAAASSQPAPLCPQGVVRSDLPEMTEGEPGPPGVSPLDQGI